MRARRSTPVAGIAIAGVVAGHALTYLVAVRQPLHRSVVLETSGHSYWTAAIAIAVVVGVLAVFAATVRVLRTAETPQRDPLGFRAAAPRLAVIQVLAYVSIEMLERLLSGASIGEMIGHHELLPIGIAVQIGVALAGAAALHLLTRTLRLVADALRPPRRRRDATRDLPAPSHPPMLRSRMLRGGWSLRGPPLRTAPAAGR